MVIIFILLAYITVICINYKTLLYATQAAYISAEPEMCISRYNSLHFSGETSTRGAEWFRIFSISDSG